MDRVRVESTNTRRVANMSPTAASSGADLNGAAALDAVRQILARLRPVAASMLADPAGGLAPAPEHVRFEGGRVLDDRDPARSLSFEEVVAQAHLRRVDLCAHGFWATPGVEFNRETGRGTPFAYYVCGAAVTEVTVDLLTGATVVDAVTIVHELGQSLNPAVDLGQVHGAFVQAMGWCTGEELVLDPRGRILSDSAATYKVPTIGDVPERFRVEFLDNPRGPRVLLRSKAIGEPPFLYGESVFFAVCEALASPGRYPDLVLPAGSERVLEAVAAAGSLAEGGRVSAAGT